MKTVKMGRFDVNAEFSIEIEDGADLNSIETFLSEAFKEFIKKATSNGFELIGSTHRSSSWYKEIKE